MSPSTTSWRTVASPPAATAPSRLAPFRSFDDFGAVTDPAVFTPLPEGWVIGLTDVVRSTEAVAAGRSKAVNMAGAAAISAIMNALDTRDLAFAFTGDGCTFVLPGSDAEVAREALSRTAAFVRDDLKLDLRAALVGVDELRASGLEVSVALFRPTPHVAYAMFDGGGVAAAEDEMKRGDHAIPAAGRGERPNLAGLSCRWLPVRARRGAVVSLIVLPGDGAAFRPAVDDLLTLLGDTEGTHPVPPEGPSCSILSPGLWLEALATRRDGPAWRRLLGVAAHNVMGWSLFAAGIRAGAFDPTAYRALTARNADCRKFGDGLLLTLDCDAALLARLEERLEEYAAAGALRYGLHRQDAALMTCIVPSPFEHGHFHFVDGAGGGYTAASRDLKARFRAPAPAHGGGGAPSAGLELPAMRAA